MGEPAEGDNDRISKPKPPSTPNRPTRRRRRRAEEWEDRRAGLSNRLDWYGFSAGDSSKTEVLRLRLAEVRMADVVFAAGAIETCYLRLRRFTRSLAKSRAWEPTDTPGLFRGDPRGGTAHHMRLVGRVPEAFHDFNSMLFWGRSLIYRIDGDWGGERVDGSRVGSDPVGVTEFLPKPDARRILAAKEELIRGPFRDVLNLASYSLHAFAVPLPGGPMKIADDGTWILPVPDRLGRPPKTGERFTFDEGHHIATEAEAIWTAAEDFVTRVFEILEAAQLRRENGLPDSSTRSG